ncbi:pentapeptide repeat-containing protein [Nitrospira sp. Nam80]
MKANPPTELLQRRDLKAVDEWNRWRKTNPRVRPRLGGTHLLSAILQRADLHDADLKGAFLREAHLYAANLRGADLRGAILVGSNLCKADLTRANLSGAILSSCSMNEGTIVQGAQFTGCNVYGIAAWGLVGDPKDQSNLVITLEDEPQIVVDNLAVAQFIYLLVNNATLRGVIDTLTSKIVLILGRFTPERKRILDKLKSHLHEASGYVPVIFDFTKPAQTTVETITLLARMARFIIADMSDAKSVLQELQAIVPTSPSLTVQPIIIDSQCEPPMIDFFKPYPWFLATIRYRTIDDLIQRLRPVTLTMTSSFSYGPASTALRGSNTRPQHKRKMQQRSLTQ